VPKITHRGFASASLVYHFTKERLAILGKIRQYFLNHLNISFGKTMINKKISEKELLNRILVGTEAIRPLVVRRRLELAPGDRADARVELGLPEAATAFPFIVEVNSQSTPLAVESAVARARSLAKGDELKLILVPYLSPERVSELEGEVISGIDLCGNGVVIVPGQFYLSRTGQPNLYPESRALVNPYRGRSSMVARMVLASRRWETLKELAEAVRKAGCEISLSQVSKSVQALQEELMVSKREGGITLLEPVRLLDQIGGAWRKPVLSATSFLRLPPGMDWPSVLGGVPGLQWAITGTSSARNYTALGEGGPMRVAVADLGAAAEALGGVVEAVPAFADIELQETEDPGTYFQIETDASGRRWASRIQCWLELQAGDARQQQAAGEVRAQILRKATT
jgi:hypothetical protein